MERSAEKCAALIRHAGLYTSDAEIAAQGMEAFPDTDVMAAYGMARRCAPGFRPGDHRANNHQRIPGKVLADLHAGRAVSSVCSTCDGTFLADSVRQRRCEVCRVYGPREAYRQAQNKPVSDLEKPQVSRGADTPSTGTYAGSAPCPTGEAVTSPEAQVYPVVKVACGVCSRPFERPVRRGRPRRYCGQECARRAANRQRQGKAVR